MRARTSDNCDVLSRLCGNAGMRDGTGTFCKAAMRLSAAAADARPENTLKPGMQWNEGSTVAAERRESRRPLSLFDRHQADGAAKAATAVGHCAKADAEPA